MKTACKIVLSVVLGTGALAITSIDASAAIACNGDVCWRVHKVYHYPPSAHVTIHPEGWHWGPNVVIRDHEGRGYWRGDHWVEWH